MTSERQVSSYSLLWECQISFGFFIPLLPNITCVCVCVCVMHSVMLKMLMLYIFSYVAHIYILVFCQLLRAFNSGTKGLIADVYVLTECAFMSHIWECLKS